ncbi:MAG: hypothetical protein ACLQQ4_15105 [Bacteroidia bacterium]
MDNILPVLPELNPKRFFKANSFNLKRKLKLCSFLFSFAGVYYVNTMPTSQKTIGISNWLIFWLYFPIIASFIIDWFIDHRDAKKDMHKELKYDIKEFIHYHLELEPAWDMTFAENYLRFKKIYNRFEEQKDIIVDVLFEIYPSYTKEQIREFIYSDIAICNQGCLLHLSRSNGTILAIVKFTSGFYPVPFLYDSNGGFIGKVQGEYVYDKYGTYKGKILNRGSHLYIEPGAYPSFKAVFQPLPDITFTRTEMECINNINNAPIEDMWVKVRQPTLVDSI